MIVPQFRNMTAAACDSGHYIAVEWPRDCAYWSAPGVMDFLDRHELTSVIFDGCAFGLQSVVDHRPIRKPWRVATNSQELVTILMHRQCRHHPSEHRKCGGRDTALTSSYPLMMSHAVHQGFEEQVRKDCELRLVDGYASQRGSGDGCRQRHIPEPRSSRPVTMEGAWPRGQQSWDYQ